MKNEIDIIEKLINKEYKEIKIDDTGGNSRAYIIDGGKIIFKFPRNNKVTYDNEAKILTIINTIKTDVKIQKVGWRSKDNTYFGLHGVTGASICNADLNPRQKRQVGKKVGKFLKKLHNINTDCVPSLSLSQEIKAWQERFLSYKEIIDTHLNLNMQKKLNKLMFEDMPKELNNLGEDIVFCHGDLGDNNILIDKDNVGIIDFNESGYFDRAADFMDICDDEILRYILDSYGASDVLRKKIQMRRRIRPVIALLFHINKNDKKGIEDSLNQIIASLS